MEILFSLVEFLIMLAGIALPITVLCVCLPIIYFVLSITCSCIMDKIHPKPEPPPPRPAILLSPGSFYSKDLPTSPQHQIFCLLPYASDADVDFDEFTMSFLRKTCRSSPFIVEKLYYNQDIDRFPLKEEDYIIEFQQKGGRVFFPNERTAFAVTTPNSPRLYEFMDRFDKYSLFYEIFELSTPLSDEQFSDPKIDLWSSDFTCSISVNREPGHNFIQIESQRSSSSFITSIWELCRQMNRELVLSPETPKVKGENSAAQS